MTRTFLSSSLLLLSSLASAQDKIINNFYNEINPATIASLKKSINASSYRIITVDLQQLYTELESAPHRDGLKTGVPLQIELPQPDGSIKRYQVMENSTLNPELSAQFPMIKTYDGYGIDNPGELAKFDLTPNGFHAMILSPGKSPVFIDPLQTGKTEFYIIYYKKDSINTSKLKCGVHSENTLNYNQVAFQHFADFNPCELKKYRLAIAATAQYTQFYGGTVPAAQAAQTTTINRVNGVYETDMAITLEIIGTNANIIYTNPNNQPYTSGNPNAMIEQNQVNVDAVIGTANYDIGHVVDAAGSGLAQIGCVCDPDIKAMGVTGRTAPVGDAFDIDYVAHEIGHQFSAQHVQNNDCERNPPTAVEPGSGSTIMGYSGICEPNIQSNSDAYFNGISLQQMGNFVASPANNCAVTTPIPAAPIIQRTNIAPITFIPVLTPFALTANALSPVNTAALTYTWEQMDNEITPQPPVSTSTGGPNFRSRLPKSSGTRYLPDLISLANNGPFTWEVLSSVSRNLNFKVSVRNNTPGGSCNAYTDVRLMTTEAAGPFVVTYPAQSGVNWSGISPERVNWNIANTNAFPVNASLVNISLSTDGGQSYPYVLATEVANIGRAEICVPNIGTTTARIMVQACNGTFFNISPNNFIINAVPARAPQLLKADRNGMNTREAFVLYADCIPPSNELYSVNGSPGATIRLDHKNHRFIIGNITTPKRTVVTITAKDSNGISRTSNPVTIPSILS